MLSKGIEAEIWKNRFEKKFDPLFREIRELKTEIYHQEGFLFIRFHKYTVEELLQSEHHDKIYSFSYKIKNQYEIWDEKGVISEIGKAEYKKICRRTENALKQVNEQIRHRQPNLWEKARGAFKGFVQLIISKLSLIPQIGINILKGFGNSKQKILQPGNSNAGTILLEGIDEHNKQKYAKLQNLLAKGMWKEADKETAWLMCQAVGRGKKGYLRTQHIKDFPCEVLLGIDKLWCEYSRGKFGFSVQRRVFKNVGDLGGDTWNTFCERVGWRNEALKRQGRQATLLYKELNFHLSAPSGHLPRSLELRGFRHNFAGQSRWMALFSRLGTCMREGR